MAFNHLKILQTSRCTGHKLTSSMKIRLKLLNIIAPQLKKHQRKLLSRGLILLNLKEIRKWLNLNLIEGHKSKLMLMSKMKKMRKAKKVFTNLYQI